MTYGLPDNGDLNWGDPVNNSVEALYALAQTAAADALAARNDAAYAKNLVNEAGDLSTAVQDAAASALAAGASADGADTSEAAAAFSASTAVAAKLGAQAARDAALAVPTTTEGLMTSVLGSGGTFDSELAAMYARIGAVDHGNKSSTVTLDALAYALHEVTLTGNVTATISGPLGASIVLRVTQDATGGRTLTLTGVTMPDGWAMPNDPSAGDTITLIRWASGWRGYVARGSAALIPVTPTAPTFTDLSGTGSDTYTIPTTTGVIYKVAGVTKAAGTYAGTGTVAVTAVAESGYDLTGTTSWAHTYSTINDYVTEVTTDAPTTFLRLEGTAANTGSVAETYTPVGLTYGTSLGDGSQAGVFDGTTTYLSAPSGTGKGLHNCTSFTIEALIKVTDVVANRYIFQQYGIAAVQISTTGKLRLECWPSGLQTTTGVASIPLNTVKHIAVTWDGTTYRLYVNGVLDQSASSTGTTLNALSSTKPYVGGVDTDTPSYKGSVDGVALYRNTVLSAARLLAHAQAAGL